ncbi:MULTISPECIES: hypothetical protein [unclassified Stenotrophomonas]|uniref:hypothetical protein n=1 Tax=unclassified Stenotrophomonas TaxID=196198 RepID=UPI0012FE9433|nr:MULTISPECIES: hypothetical protein [unclassified Stenotrophomonas]
MNRLASHSPLLEGLGYQQFASSVSLFGCFLDVPEDASVDLGRLRFALRIVSERCPVLEIKSALANCQEKAMELRANLTHVFNLTSEFQELWGEGGMLNCQIEECLPSARKSLRQVWPSFCPSPSAIRLCDDAPRKPLSLEQPLTLELSLVNIGPHPLSVGCSDESGSLSPMSQQRNNDGHRERCECNTDADDARYRLNYSRQLSKGRRTGCGYAQAVKWNWSHRRSLACLGRMAIGNHEKVGAAKCGV